MTRYAAPDQPVPNRAPGTPLGFEGGFRHDMRARRPAAANSRMAFRSWVLHPLLAPVGLLLAALLVSLAQGAHAETGFALHTEKPALARAGGGNWDSAYVDPGTVMFHDGAFHMFYVAIPRWPHPLAIGYARSSDGFEWARQADGPVLTHDQTGAIAATSIIASSALVTEDGTWVLYVTSVAPGEAFYGSVIRATAPGPLGPWTVDPEPALTPGSDGAWDGVAIGDASVVRTADGYAMYYAGFGNFQNGAFAEKRANIGLATSADGVSWTKFDDPGTTDASYGASDPVLVGNADETGWDTFRLVDPNVQKTPEGWIMSYRGATFESSTAIGLATSTDGVTWQRASDRPVMTDKDAGKKIFFTSLLSRPEQDFLFIELGSTSGTDAFVATRARLPQ